MLVEQCGGCTKAAEMRCKVFTDPEYQHRGGRVCYGRSTDPDWEEKVIKAVVEYSAGKKY